MSDNDLSSAAISVLGEQSRDGVRAELLKASTTLGDDGFLEFIVDLLLQSNMDRDRLKKRVVALMAARFGDKSGKSSEDQLALFDEIIRRLDGEKPKDDTASEPPMEDVNLSKLMAETERDIEGLLEQEKQAKREESERRRQAKKDARANGESSPNWPTHLPIHEVIRDIPEYAECCESCDQARVIIGYETSWRLEYTTRTVVLVTKTPIVACKSHHGGPVTEAAEPKPVNGGRMGFSLAAQVLYLRYTRNIPVCSIVEMLQVQGVPISEEMVHTLIRVTAKRAKPVMDALATQVRQSTLVNLDDTPVRVLKTDRKPDRHKARIWLALGDEHWAWFFATKSWAAAEAEKRLGTLTGTVQGDGYAGYPKFAKRQDLSLAGCWGHARRKFFKAVKAKDPRAGPAMALIQGLYRVEKLAKLRHLGPDDIAALRQERSAPLVRQLRKWAEDVASSIVSGSELGKAWTYLQTQWPRLLIFLTDGSVSLTNDAAERGLRRITIGRKLWLFFQNDKNAEWAAVLASLMATARLHGANELDYITWLLRELARREWSHEAARCLLPDVWLAAQKQSEEGSSAQP